MGIRVMDDIHAFLGTIAEEIYRMCIEVFLVGLCRHNVGTYLSDGFQGTGINTGIDLHPSGVEHRTEQGVFLWYLTEQDGYTQQFQRRHSDQLQITTVADALGHRDADTETRVGTWTATDGYGIEGNGVIIGKREGLVYHRTQSLGVIGTRVVFLLEDDLRVLRYGDGANIRTRLYM